MKGGQTIYRVYIIIMSKENLRTVDILRKQPMGVYERMRNTMNTFIHQLS